MADATNSASKDAAARDRASAWSAAGVSSQYHNPATARRQRTAMDRVQGPMNNASWPSSAKARDQIETRILTWL